jgi:hypothetical protein
VRRSLGLARLRRREQEIGLRRSHDDVAAAAAAIGDDVSGRPTRKGTQFPVLVGIKFEKEESQFRHYWASKILWALWSIGPRKLRYTLSALRSEMFVAFDFLY